MQQIKRIIIIGLTVLCAVTAVGVMTSHHAYADAVGASKTAACQGASLGGSDATCGTAAGGDSLTSLIGTVLTILSIVVGVAAVIMIIVGGLRFVLSAGDSNATSSARNTILYALIGLIIAALAQVMVHFVLNRVSS